MSKVYKILSDDKAVPMNRIHCKNEERELQNLLEQNHDLLPGDQISPDDPRRWLLVKRVMSVEDPSTGGPRWSIDFFFVDQDGVPTFVECKRFGDTRSRREVVAQMLEYAANGHYYWTKTTIQECATKEGVNLEKALKRLKPEGVESLDEFLGIDRDKSP